MPTPEWNRRWVDEYHEQQGSKMDYYGAHWGDPDPALAFPSRWRKVLPESLMAALLTIKPLRNALNARRRDKTTYQPPLYKVLTRYVRPYIRPDVTVLEIGPGGGRWTKYMLQAKHLTLVELNTEFFDYLRNRFAAQLSKLRFYQTRDYELEGVESSSIDFGFSFGVFVHIDPEGIQAYLAELARVVKSGGHIVIQYADKTKEGGRERTGFSDMTPAKMEGFVAALPALEILKHDTTLLNHSSVIILRKR